MELHLNMLIVESLLFFQLHFLVLLCLDYIHALSLGGAARGLPFIDRKTPPDASTNEQLVQQGGDICRQDQGPKNRQDKNEGVTWRESHRKEGVT